MNEERARQLLKNWIGGGGEDYQSDDLLGCAPYIAWRSDGLGYATLDGEFTADQLEAVAWWIKNKKAK